MIDFVLGFLSDFVAWLVGVLPASPFQGLILGLGSDELVWLGWLNWLVPVGDIVFTFELWLAAVVSVMGVYFIVHDLVGAFLGNFISGGK